MTTVLLVNPVVREEDAPRHVPMGLALLAAIAIKNGHRVQVFDANAHRASDAVLEQVLRADRWDVIALGGITTAYRSIKHIVGMARTLCPNALIVLGGGVLTSLPHEIMGFLPEVDIGVVGEGFRTFPMVLRRAERTRGHKARERVPATIRDTDTLSRNGLLPYAPPIPGVVYREADGVTKLTPAAPLLDDLDSLPYPAWDLFPLDVYFRNSMALYSEEGMLARRRLDVNASYGCSLVCRFCFHLGTTGDMEYVEKDGRTDVRFGYKRQIRMHSPRYVVDMVKHVRDQYGVDFIGFLDENLMTMHVSSGKTWLTEICRLWIEEGLQPQCVRDGVAHDPDRCSGVHWGGTSHATLCNPDLLKLMRRAGCSHLVYGYETFSKRVMKTIGKGATPETNERSLRWTLEAGIRPIPNQMIGFPDEDFDSLYDNIAAWDRIGITVKPFFCTPYPGTEWFQTYRKEIEAQYGGDLEAFLLDVGDATRVTATMGKFSAVELYGLRELMVQRDLRKLRQYEEARRG